VKKRLRLTIAYDGTPWQGWQSQTHGMGVQDQVEKALSTIAKVPVKIEGSGRTDRGVHAIAQIAHADVPAGIGMTGDSWVRAANCVLPSSIRLMHCEDAAPDFHARFQTKGKIYRYRVSRSAPLSPFEANRAWLVYGDLDNNAIQTCLGMLVGRHNFARLAANRGDFNDARKRGGAAATTRTIFRAEAQEEDQVLTLEFEGDGFLYKMVRLITGSIVHVARGRAGTDWFASLLSEPEGLKSHHCAPPEGLYLVRVMY
jgi:tRNA pseudouridine38-40 synthase